MSLVPVDLKLFTTFSTSASVEMFQTFLKEVNDGEALKIECTIKHRKILLLVTGATAGAILGGIAGAKIGTIISPGDGTIIGGISGACIGAFIGKKCIAVLGDWYERNTKSEFMISSVSTLQWQTRRVDAFSYGIFKRFIASDVELKKYLCPISSELPLIPVIAKCNHVFDLSSLQSRIKENSICPVLGCLTDLRDSEFSFHATTINKIWERISSIISSMPQADEESRQILQTCVILRKEISYILSKMLSAERRVITSGIREGMSQDEEETRFEALNRRYFGLYEI